MTNHFNNFFKGERVSNKPLSEVMFFSRHENDQYLKSEVSTFQQLLVLMEKVFDNPTATELRGVTKLEWDTIPQAHKKIVAVAAIEWGETPFRDDVKLGGLVLQASVEEQVIHIILIPPVATGRCWIGQLTLS